MPTPHEELLALKTKFSDALNESIDCDLYGLREMPFFGRKEYIRKHAVRVKELNDAYEELAVKYLEMFVDVLEEKHGVSKNNIVQLGAGTCMEPIHPFTALVGTKIREMEAVSVGNRIVFFLDGVALGEDEKADYGTINC